MSSNELKMTDAAELTMEELNEVSGGWSWRNALGGGVTLGAVAAPSGPATGLVGFGVGFVIGGLTG